MATTSNNHPFGALFAIILTLAFSAGAVLFVRWNLQRRTGIPAVVGIDKIQDVRGLGYSGQRKIVSASDGSVYVAYRKNFRNNSEIFVARIFSQYGKTTITGTDKPIAAIGREDDQRVPSMAIDSKGKIHVLWYGSDEAGVKNNRQIKYASSSDKGKSWSSWRNITFVPGFAPEMDMWQEHPMLLVGRDDTLYAVWEGKDNAQKYQQIKFSFSANGGDSWSAWKNVHATPGASQSRPSLVEDPQGRLYLFMYSSGGRSDGIQKILYASSLDKGVSWSAWKVLSDGKSDARHVSASSDALGNVFVAWRQSTGSNGPSQILFRTLKNGRWSRVASVSPSSRFQFFPSLGVDASGDAYVSWMETSDASDFPHEDPQSGSSLISFMKKGAFQAPLLLGESGSNLYPNVPAARIPEKNKLPVVFEEKSGTDPNVFTVKLRLISPASEIMNFISRRF